MLPNVRVVVLLGRPAAKAWRTLGFDLEAIEASHPSPLNLNTHPERREEIRLALAEARSRARLSYRAAPVSAATLLLDLASDRSRRCSSAPALTREAVAQRVGARTTGSRSSGRPQTPSLRGFRAANSPDEAHPWPNIRRPDTSAHRPDLVCATASRGSGRGSSQRLAEKGFSEPLRDPVLGNFHPRRAKGLDFLFREPVVALVAALLQCLPPNVLLHRAPWYGSGQERCHADVSLGSTTLSE